MKYLLVSLILSLTFVSIYGQNAKVITKHLKKVEKSKKKQSAVISLDTAFYSGIPIVLVKKNISAPKSETLLVDFSGKILVKLKKITFLAGATNTYRIYIDGIKSMAAQIEYKSKAIIKDLLVAKVLTPKGIDKEKAQFYATRHPYRPRTATSSTSSTATAPTPSSRVSFSVKNNGSKTLRTFLGTRPKWGSGTYSTLGGNTVSSYSGNVGQKFCVVDKSDNGISCVTLSQKMGKIYINKAGTGFE